MVVAKEKVIDLVEDRRSFCADLLVDHQKCDQRGLFRGLRLTNPNRIVAREGVLENESSEFEGVVKKGGSQVI